jgi:hypothetical protein
MKCPKEDAAPSFVNVAGSHLQDLTIFTARLTQDSSHERDSRRANVHASRGRTKASRSAQDGLDVDSAGQAQGRTPWTEAPHPGLRD